MGHSTSAATVKTHDNKYSSLIKMISMYCVYFVKASRRLRIARLTRIVFQRKTDVLPPTQSHLLNPTSAFASAHIIIQDFGYVDIIYRVSCKDMSIPSEAFKVLLRP